MVPVSLKCHTSIFITGRHVNWCPFSRSNVRIIWCWCFRLGNSNIRASAQPMVSFSGFYESHKIPPSSDARSIVLPHHNGHWNGQQSGYMLHYCCVDCHPCGCRGDMEQVVARWQHPVAFGEALVMLHWAMRSILRRHTAMAIKIACNGGAFFCRYRLFWLL